MEPAPLVSRADLLRSVISNTSAGYAIIGHVATTAGDYETNIDTKKPTPEAVGCSVVS